MSKERLKINPIVVKQVGEVLILATPESDVIAQCASHREDRADVERYEEQLARLGDFLANEFPHDTADGDLIVDAAIKLLTRMKRALATQAVGDQIFGGRPQ